VDRLSPQNLALMRQIDELYLAWPFMGSRQLSGRLGVYRKRVQLTQRGNRRQSTFFCEEDYKAYSELMGRWCKERGVAVWVYCLMPNHVHLIALPRSEDSLRRAIGEAHRRYTRRVNFRARWRNHLWQGRFASFVLDEPCLEATETEAEESFEEL